MLIDAANDFISVNALPMGNYYIKSQSGFSETRIGQALLSTVVCLALATAAAADYSTASGYSVTYINLRPAGHVSGVVWAGVGTQQAGGDGYAAIWSGTPESFVDLTPPGFSSAIVQGTTGSQQAGTVYTETASYAAAWSGSAASFVNLAPRGALYSHASGASGNQQVGDVTFSIGETGFGLVHAAIWSGTAESFVDLHPAEAFQSFAYGTTGSRQVGSASFPSSGYADHAALWSGSADSFIDLNPAGATMSIARAISGNQQVGYAILGGIYRAGIWSGTAESFIDLNPAGASGSFGMGTSGNAQAGDAFFDHYRALLWFGSSSSFLDLEASLGSDYTRESHAMAVWTEGPVIYVGGYALNPANYPDPILWVIVPEPSVAVLGGLGAVLGAVRARKARIARRGLK